MMHFRSYFFILPREHITRHVQTPIARVYTAGWREAERRSSYPPPKKKQNAIVTLLYRNESSNIVH